jgi:myosin-crossreactive antigen
VKEKRQTELEKLTKKELVNLLLEAEDVIDFYGQESHIEDDCVSGNSTRWCVGKRWSAFMQNEMGVKARTYLKKFILKK